MASPSFLSRPDFDRACRAFIAAQPHPPPEATPWTWNEHPAYRLGYMSRDVTLLESPIDLDDSDELQDSTVTEADDVAVAVSSDPALSCAQYVVYSATFQVPAFYFTVSRPDGSPLALDDIMSSSLLMRRNLSHAEATSFGLLAESSPFPLLSQGEHPTLGTPCWYFHPCETTKAVAELLADSVPHGATHDERLAAWMRAWFAVLSTVVNVR